MQRQYKWCCMGSWLSSLPFPRPPSLRSAVRRLMVAKRGTSVVFAVRHFPSCKRQGDGSLYLVQTLKSAAFSHNAKKRSAVTKPLLLPQFLQPSLLPGKQEWVASDHVIVAAQLPSQRREAQLLTVIYCPPDSRPRQPQLLLLKLEPQLKRKWLKLSSRFCVLQECFFPLEEGCFGLFISHLSNILIRSSWKQKGICYFSLTPFFSS